MKKILLLLIAVAWTSSSCEKDDICDEATATTPRLIIHFYDFNNPALDKNVTNLVIVGEGLSEGLKYNESQIGVPLRTTADFTKYRFILNYGNADPALVDEDNLQFNYTRNNNYISRACGFKTLFVLNAENPYQLTDSGAAEGLWIKNITLTQPNILNENEIHLKIYF